MLSYLFYAIAIFIIYIVGCFVLYFTPHMRTSVYHPVCSACSTCAFCNPFTLSMNDKEREKVYSVNFHYHSTHFRVIITTV